MAETADPVAMTNEARRGLLRASVAWLGVSALPLSVRAATSVNVRSMGARGNGLADDTASFQKAIDAVAARGGVVVVPPGRYLIDPLRSVRLRSHVDLRMASGAKLIAKPNGAPRAYVLLV